MQPRFPASLLRRLLSFILFALCTLSFELNAQYFTLGTDPASVRWNQVKTEHFRLIYPQEWESRANYIANAFEYARKPVSSSLNTSPRKWPVILHKGSVVSNAFAPYAPKRIEIITTPPQDNYPQDWIDQLILHEFRHSVQYTSLDRGLTRALSFLMGQQAVPAVIGLFVPFWFIEGDAVTTETALSLSGRGRVPAFEMKLRSQFLEKGIYSYDKAVNGSYRDFIPDHYELGYLLVGRARQEYGSGTWSRVMHKTGSMPLMIVPFSHTLYNETGFGKRKLYHKITSELREEWIKEDLKIGITSYESLIKENNKYYTSRKQPVEIDQDLVLAIRTSIDDIPRLVVIDSAGTETIVATPGTMTDEGISAAGNMACWAEVTRDPRWPLQKYSVIKTTDLETGIIRKITGNSRYFSPDLSPDAKAIATVEVDEASASFLVILSATNGKILKKITAEKDHFLSYPDWSDDGKQIAIIVNSKDGKSLALADTANGTIKILMPFSHAEISRPVFYGGQVLFTAAFTGIDNIFAIDINTKEIKQVTSSRFGATDAAVSSDGKTLYYSDYTSNGYDVVASILEPGNWEKWDLAGNHHFALADELAGQENFIFRHDSVPDSVYQSKRYRKGLHLFNFHSWPPLAIDIDHTEINPGVTLLSQNLLSTSFATLGYEYDLNEETGKYTLGYSYEGLYPAFSLSVDYGLNKAVHTDTAGARINYQYHELNLSGGASVPLNWYVKSWFMGFQPYAGYSYKYLRMDPDSELKFKKDRINSLDYRVFFYTQSRMSYRDLQPRWGQVLELNYRHTPFTGDTANSIFSAEMVLYLPGFTRHHGFKFYGGYQDRIHDNYYYNSLISFPRGFTGIYSNQAISGSLAYVFPVVCPDRSLGPALYLKRIKAAVFYDYAILFDREPDQSYYSTGLDLTFDFHVLRNFVPLEAGLRTIYLPQDETFVFELLYSINLSY
jgi:hypothetical protein